MSQSADDREFGQETNLAQGPVDLANAEDELIHTPGSIQPHGVLVVARASDLRVVFASANAESAVGVPALSMLGRPLQDFLDGTVYGDLVHQDDDGRAIFEPSRSRRRTVDGIPWYFEVRQFNELLYVEIESEVGEEEIESLPIVTQRMIGKMRSAASLTELLDFTALELQRLTGYDRVMAYQFEEDGHGVVIAESAAPGMEPYLGLHYPASDVSAQAKRLYLMQRVSLVADSDYSPVPILSDARRPVGAGPVPPLDMTYCNLRSVSPLHLKYLKNMGVGSTLTLSLIVDDKLWGLLICQHRKPRLPSLAIRSSCDLISQITSFLIRSRIELDNLEFAKQANARVEEIAVHLDQQIGICAALSAAEDQLLPLVGAAGALICFEGTSKLIGITPPLAESVRLMNRLQSVSGGKVFSHNSLPALLPEFASLRTCACGVLLMPIMGSPENAVLWFRPEAIETVKWGGNPQKPVREGSLSVSPAKAVETWKTLVKSRSLFWKPADVSVANKLRRAITDHILAKAEGVFSNLGLIDTLTLLPNRRRFQNDLRVRAEDSKIDEVSVILVNLDRFKQVNEAFGHTSGDLLLLQVTRRLSKFVSSEVMLARLGADEFAILCTGNMAARAQELAGNINGALASPFQLSGKPFRVTASLGIAHASHCDAELLRAADTAMHFAKRTGRNRLVAFDKLLQETVSKSLEMQQDLFHALEAHEFKLMYQPIVNLPDGTLHGFEALIRWHHPVKGLIPPLDFIPLAEETGLILQIGQWVLHEAVKNARKWTEMFGRPLMIHVNAAASQLVGETFVQEVKTVLRESSLSPAALSIEVTETALMRDTAVESLRELKALGVEVSIDDFGTGYSSLAYLQKLPVDIVKIDKTFIDDIAHNAKSRELLRALLALIQTMGLKPIAEGVETEGQRSVLVALGFGQAQGYLFSKPLDNDAAEELIATRRKAEWLPTRS